MIGHRRGLTRRACVCAAVLAAAVAGAISALAASPPSDPAGFTAFVVQKFHAARPTDEIKVIGELQLDIKAPAGEFTTDLHTVRSACERMPDRCEEIVTEHVANLSAFHGAPLSPLHAAQLRVVVRPAAFVEGMRRVAPPGAEPVAAPLAGGLWLIGAADMQTTVMLLNTASLSPLKLSGAQVLARGRRNLHAGAVKALAGLEDEPRPDGVAAMMGDDYQSSLLAFPELWAPLATKGEGDLYVAAPANDIVIFCKTKRRDAVKTMLKAGAAAAAQSDRPLPLVVLRWTPDGWAAANGPES